MARHLWREMQFTISLNSFFYFFLSGWTNLIFQWNFTYKKKYIKKKVLVCWIGYIAHNFYIILLVSIFYDLFLYCTKKVKKNVLSSCGWNPLHVACSDLDVNRECKLDGLTGWCWKIFTWHFNKGYKCTSVVNRV